MDIWGGAVLCKLLIIIDFMFTQRRCLNKISRIFRMHRMIIDIYPVYPFNPFNLVQNDGLICLFLSALYELLSTTDLGE